MYVVAYPFYSSCFLPSNASLPYPLPSFSPFNPHFPLLPPSFSTGTGFIFEDQFLQISALLPTSNIYGLGEHTTRLRLPTNITLTMFSHDTPPLPSVSVCTWVTYATKCACVCMFMCIFLIGWVFTGICKSMGNGAGGWRMVMKACY